MGLLALKARRYHESPNRSWEQGENPAPNSLIPASQDAMEIKAYNPDFIPIIRSHEIVPTSFIRLSDGEVCEFRENIMERKVEVRKIPLLPHST